MKTYLIAVLLGLSFILDLQAQNKTLEVRNLTKSSERRVAVIFANQDYRVDRYDLKKTYNDADDMKTALERLGFRVITLQKDLGRVALDTAIRNLKTKLRGYDVAFVYYSGHGSIYRDENFLIPTDIPTLEDNADVEMHGVSLNKIYEALEESGIKTSIVALDACRSLVYGKGGAATGMMIPANNPAGTFTMFATRLGKIAKENLQGRNSYFTQELLKHIETPNLTLNQIFHEIRRGVKSATAGTQEPGASDELDAEFVFIKTVPTTRLLETKSEIVNPTVDKSNPKEPTTEVAVVVTKGGVMDAFELAQKASDILTKQYANYSFVPYEKGKSPRGKAICEISEFTENDPENKVNGQIHKYKTRLVLTVRNGDQLISRETLDNGGTDYSKENAQALSVTRTLELTEKLKFEKR